MKKRLFAILLVISISVMSLMLSGCSATSKVYSLIESAAEKTNELDSIDAVINMRVVFDPSIITMEIPVVMQMKASGLKGDNPTARVNQTITVRDQTVESDIYMEGSSVYVSSMGTNFKTTADDLGDDSNGIETMGQIIQVLPKDALENAKVIEGKDGIKTVELTLTDEFFNQTYKDLLSSMGEIAGYGKEAAYKLNDIKVEITIEDEYITKYSVDFKAQVTEGSSEAMLIEMSANIRINNPGQQVTVSAIEGYENFPDLSGAQ